MSTLVIAGIDRWSLLAQETLRVEDQLNARNICEFTLYDQAGTARPLIGQVVVVTIDGIVRFAGTIDKFTEKNVTSKFTNAYRSYAISCVDYNQYCDRHIVANVYENYELIDLVRDVMLTHLYTDGVTLDPAMADGPTIIYYATNYISVARVFDELSEMTGYFWYIDSDKILHFVDRTVLIAPYILNQSTNIDLVESLETEHTRAQYRNHQYIRGGITKTDLQVEETSKGDGETTTFVTSLPVASAPTISIDTGGGFVLKTVGIRQVDTGYDWYWQEDSNQISQDTGGTVLSATSVIKILYYGYYPLIDAARIQSEVQGRIDVEGGSGLYEMVENRADITSADLSHSRAEGLLALFGSIQTRIAFSTLSTGWQAGQLLTVTRAEHGIDEQFIIAEVSYEHDGTDRYLYHIRAVSGSLVENWVAFFKRLAQQDQRSVRRPNEVVNLLRLFYEDISIEELFATPGNNSSVLGEILANEILEASSAEKHWIGFAVIGPLDQTVNHANADESLPLHLSEITSINVRGAIGESMKLGFSETSSVTVLTP